MRIYTLSGADMTAKDDFHKAIAARMEFPEYYGHNLDALFDILTDPMEETTLILTGCSALEANLGAYYRKIRRTLEAASRENASFAVQFLDQGMDSPDEEDTCEKPSYFSMVSPESLGIHSDGIDTFLSQIESKGLELHRFMILRHGKCCSKINWLPYTAEDHHPMYSFSKSLTATAIGFARQEGLLTLDEKIVDLFPEDCPEEISENLAACTIHHLLCMSCGQETESYDNSADWRKKFLAHPFLHAPGTFYKYNTTGTNMLAAVIRKKTGLQVTEYLRPRLLDPLGMGEIRCAQLPDDLQTQHGGGGMKMQLEDMAKFAQFMLQDGVWEGKNLLADWYSTRAGVKQMETAGDSEGHVYDWAYGYGYQCWMGSLPGSYRADGAFGQFGLVYPSLDLCVIMSSATEQTQTILDLVNKHLLPAVEEDDLRIPAQNASQRFNDEESGNAIIETRSLQPLSSCHNPTFEQILNHAVYCPDSSEKKGMGLDGIRHLVGGAGLFDLADDPQTITQIRFAFSTDQLSLYLEEDGTEKVLNLGLEREFIYSEIDGIRYAGTARWRSLRRLEMEIRRMDAMSGVRLILSFRDDRLTFEADDTLMTDGGLGMVERRLVPFVQQADLQDLNIEKTGNNPGVK